MLKISLLGCGNIGKFILKSAAQGVGNYDVVGVFDIDADRVLGVRRELGMAFDVVDNIDDLVRACDLVVEAASQRAVKDYSVRILESNRNLMILSVGALSDENLFSKLKKIAKRRNLKIYIPSGAVVGVDGLSAAKIARIRSVTLLTRKPPYALGIDADGEKIIYNGVAKEGIRKFPFNVNVAATLGLVGIGMEKTKLKILADPKVRKNTHEIHVDGDFGEFSVKTKNVPSPDNPKTSLIAALSAVAMLNRISDPVEIGT